MHLPAEVLAAQPGLDGVACFDDPVALGAPFECQRRGIAVPDRLAVMGFGDPAFSASCVPPLTTIRPPGEGIGRRVGRLIEARLRGAARPASPQSFDLGFSLVVRLARGAPEYLTRAPEHERPVRAPGATSAIGVDGTLRGATLHGIKNRGQTGRRPAAEA